VEGRGAQENSSGVMGRRILVTGASGFIGAALTARLRTLGFEVDAVSRRAPDEERAGVRWRVADLGDAAAAATIVREVRPDVIFHLSGYVYGSRALSAVLPSLQSNLQAAVNLMVAALDARCGRLVLAGSMEEPQTGAGEVVPSSPYAAAKWAAGAYARMCHALYQLPVVILRIFMVYGPGQRDLNKLVPYVTLSLLRGETPGLSSGARKVDWVYVDDVVDALVAAGAAVGLEGRTVDVGSGRLVSIRDVVNELVRITGASVTPAFGALPDRAMEVEPVADTAQAFALLGWRARTSLEAGLRSTVDWYAQASMLHRAGRTG